MNSNTPSCQICINPYNEEENTPIIISCGHTFCKTCVKTMFSTSILFSSTLSITNSNINSNLNNSLLIEKCPVCKKTVNGFTNCFIPNYELLSIVSLTKKKLDNSCEQHINENLNFYCNTCKQLICQICLLINHISHELKRPEDSDLSKSLEIFTSYNNIVTQVRENKLNSTLQLNNRFNSITNKFKVLQKNINDISNYMKLEYYINNNKLNLLSENLETMKVNIKDEYNQIIKKNSKSKIEENLVNKFDDIKKVFQDISYKFSDEYETSTFMKLNEISNFICCFKNGLFDGNSELKKMDDQLKSSSFCNIVNPIDFIYEGKINRIVYDISGSSKEHLELVEKASIEIKCDSQFIVNIMKSIDRADFVKSISSHTYKDQPLMIGWNTTISAPHMHMLTILYLSKVLETEAILAGKYSATNKLKALDIGSGSGFMTLALSKLLGPYSIVYGIDHIDEIISFSTGNVQKHHNEFLTNGEIFFVNKDGKNGHSEFGKYNLIHVGAAVTELPQCLLDQLEFDGYMWIPIGPKTSNKQIFLVHKDKNGIIKKTELLSCSYAEMTSVEEQLSHIEDILDDRDMSVSLEEESF